MSTNTAAFAAEYGNNHYQSSSSSSSRINHPRSPDPQPFDFAIDEMKEEHYSHQYQYHQPQMNTMPMDYNNYVSTSSSSNSTGPNTTGIDDVDYDDDINEEEEDMDGPVRYFEKTLDVVDEEDDQNALEMEMIRQLTEPMLTTMSTSPTIKEKKIMETIEEKVEEEELVQQQPAKPRVLSSFTSFTHKRNKSKKKRGNRLEDKIRKLILENETASTSVVEGRSDDYHENNGRFHDSHSSRVSRASTSYSSTSSASIGRIHDVVVLSTDDILNDLGKTAEEAGEIASSSYGYGGGDGAFPHILDRSNVAHDYEQEYEEEEKKEDDHTADDEEEDFTTSNSQFVSSQDGTVQKGTAVSKPIEKSHTDTNKEEEQEEQQLQTADSIGWSDKWTAFGSFPALSAEGRLDENGFPILESETPTSLAVLKEKEEDDVVEEQIQCDDSYSEAEEEEELAKTLAAEFQGYEEEEPVGNSPDDNDNHRGQLLDDSSEIFDNLAATSILGNIDNDTGSFNEPDGRRQTNQNDSESSFTRSVSRMATFGRVAHDLDETEQQTFQKEIESPARYASPSSPRKEDSVASADSSNNETGSPVSNMDSNSAFSSSVGSTSPSSVTQFSGSGSLSSHHKRYKTAREFARRRKAQSRSRPMRRVDRSPVKSPAQSPRTREELMEEVPRNTPGLRNVETSWRPNPPRHYNRPTNRI
mmetsp:Transcript_22624/g.53524  ORF Transcript_22624/g.53524 Transcript_22624/m.53524 type:complete len:698 (-) Transcript_22624:1461-3554(-)